MQKTPPTETTSYRRPPPFGYGNRQLYLHFITFSQKRKYCIQKMLQISISLPSGLTGPHPGCCYLSSVRLQYDYVPPLLRRKHFIGKR